RFPAARRTQDGKKLTLPDAQAHLVQCQVIVVPAGQLLQLDQVPLSVHLVPHPVRRRRINSAIVTTMKDATMIRLPSASALGNFFGNRSCPHRYTGKVGSEADRKNAIRNSSNEIVNVSSTLATMPGRASGNTTRQKVCHGLSPRSSEASS